MSRCRVPVVIGLEHGVGASPVTRALDAHEAASGPTRGQDICHLAADIAVCSGGASLQRAEALRGAPLMLIVLVDDRPPPSPARVRELGACHNAVIVLPHVPHWADLSHPPDEATVLLAQRPTHLPLVLRGYADGLRLAVAALIRSGTLRRPEPPLLNWPPTTPPRPAPPPRPLAPRCPTAVKVG
jgi:hypothetical protein